MFKRLNYNARTHSETLMKFLLLAVVLVAYGGYLGFKYDLATGGLLAALTWSFFVLCTPVADAGFLLDFPLRLLFGIRMVISEIAVWVIAIALNIYAINTVPNVYEATFLTSLFKTILTTPDPYWAVIALSGIGTFLSIIFGDEMMDVFSHKDCVLRHSHGFFYKLLATVTVMALTLVLYYHLLEKLNLNLGF